MKSRVHYTYSDTAFYIEIYMFINEYLTYILAMFSVIVLANLNEACIEMTRQFQ